MVRILCLFVLFAQLAFAAGTVTVTRSDLKHSPAGPESPFHGSKYVIDWVGDASDGSVPATDITLEGYIVKVITNPGSPSPTDNYDLALADPEDAALDALGGALANRHTTTTQQVYPLIAGAPGTVTVVVPYLNGSYAFTLTNNSVNSAKGRVILYVAYPR